MLRSPPRRSSAGPLPRWRRPAALVVAALSWGVGGARLAQAAEPSAERAPEPWVLTSRSLVVYPSAGTSEHPVELGLQVAVLEAGWLSLPLGSAGLRVEALRLNGRPASWAMGADGPVFVAKLPVGRHTIAVEGVASGGPRSLDLRLGLAASASLRLVGESLSVEVEGANTPAGPGRWDLGPGERVALRWSEAVPPPPRPMALRAELMVALRVDELGVEGRADLGLVVSHGRLDRLSIEIPSATELELLGPDGAPLRDGSRRIEGQGGSFALVFDPPVEGSVALSLRYRAPVPGPLAVAAPLPTLGGARELSGWLSLSQEDGLMLAPEAQAGLEAASLASRPARARGLTAGAPLAAWRITGPRPALRWADLGASTLQGPALLIDQADYRLATEAHGRLAMRATWQVRNDRQQYLRVRMPEGWSPIGARVAGRPVAPVRVDENTLLIPLERSVETFSGLVALPVELNMVGREAAWARRGWRSLESPAVDAPVASARWRIDLPQERRVRRLEGTPRPAGAPSGRLDMGFALNRGAPVEPRAADEDNRRLRSQETWNQAYSAYKNNDFEVADSLLREAATLDPSNAAAKDLQGNVDLLLGRSVIPSEDKDKAKVARKVKAMAWAKADDSRAAQQSDLEAAAAASSAGDLRGAVSAYRSAAEQTRRLAALEQDEAVEEKERLAQLEQQVQALEAELLANEAAERAQMAHSGKSAPSASLGSSGARLPVSSAQRPAQEEGKKSALSAEPPPPPAEPEPILLSEREHEVVVEDVMVLAEAGPRRAARGEEPSMKAAESAPEKVIQRAPGALPTPVEAKPAASANGTPAPVSGATIIENTYVVDGLKSEDAAGGQAQPLRSGVVTTFDFEDISGELLRPDGSLEAFGYTVDEPGAVEPAERWYDGDVEGGISGGVEGGVAGGVVGGVVVGIEGGVLGGEVVGILSGVVGVVGGASDASALFPAAPAPDGGVGFGGRAADRREALNRRGGDDDAAEGEGHLPVDPADAAPDALRTIDRQSLESVPVGRSYQSAVVAVAGVSRSRVRSAVRRLVVRRTPPLAPGHPPVAPPPPPPPVAWVDGAPWIAPAGLPQGPVHPAPNGPQLRRPPGEKPVAEAIAVPVLPAVPLEAPPVRATPERAALPLPLPTGVDAITLTLSMPDSPEPLELQQQLVAADEPLRVRLRVVPRR